MRNQPPKLAEKFLLLFLKDELAEEVLGDLDEKFYRTIEKKSLRRAKLNYWYQVFNYLRPFALKRILKWKYRTINSGMLVNYWNTARRFFGKNWGLTTLNVAVFGIGLAACLLILNKVSYEFSYDKFYDEDENIYRVSLDHYYPHDAYQNSTAVSFYPIGSELANQYPEVENFTRVSFKRRNTIVEVDEKSFQENDFYVVDPSFFEVFSVEMLYGDTIDIGAYDVFLAESMARKLFGKADVIGASVGFWGDFFKVKGVYKNIPEQSHFNYNMLLTVLHNENRMSDWEHYSVYTYIVLKDGVKESDLENKLASFNTEFSKLSDEQSGVDYRWEITLQPLSSIYLSSDLHFEHEINGDIQSVYMLMIMAFLIIIISCFNFINLANSMYAKRLREFFIRKVHGANAITLLKQYAFESTLLLVFGFSLAIGLMIILPHVTDYSIRFMDQSLMFYLGLGGILFVTLLLSIVLPSSAFALINPLKFVNGEYVTNPIIKGLAKSLIVVQFVVSFLLLAGSITISKQLNFISHENPGIVIDDVISLDFPGLYFPNHREELLRFKNEIESQAGVASVSYAESVPGTKHSIDGSIRFVGDEIENAKFNYYQIVSSSYFETYKINVLQGKVFDDLQQADSASILINETMAKELGVQDYADVIGKKVVMPWGGAEYPTFQIVGVTKDYYHESLKNEIEPVAYLPISFYANCNKASIRLAGTNNEETIDTIEASFKSIFPHVFNLEYVEDSYAGFLSSYNELSDLINALAFLAILMSGVGLFGLASNETAKKTKEVAIRKVNGAQRLDIYILFLKKFGKLVGIAFLISIPVSFYFADNWLNNFAVRINLGVWFFWLQILITTVVGIVSISYFLIKMSLQNPVVALKNGE